MQQIDPELFLQIVAEDSDPIAYDTETNGLDIHAHAVGYVITNSSDSLYIPVRHEGGGNIPDAEGFERDLARAFAERSACKFRTVGHNLGFDLRISNRQGIILAAPLEDTMINELLINDLTQGYGLEDSCRRHGVTPKLGAELYAAIAARFGGLPDRKQMANFYKMPGDDPKVVDYATGDGTSTLELWASQQPILDRDELRIPWQLECDLLPYVARIHARGFRIDPRMRELMPNGKMRAIHETDEAIAKASEAFSPGFNVNSPKEVEALYRANGYGDADFDWTEPTRLKPNGQTSFTEKWLETNEIGDAILSVRRLKKARDSFITPLVDTYFKNGRVHPVLNQSRSDDNGVAGARFSCTDPNMQAFPKRNKSVGKVVRKVVVADEGFVIYEADFSQQEPRFFTHYSEEPSLVEGYGNNTFDIHDKASELLELERDVAKRLGLGILTMMSAKTLAMHMRWEYKRAKAAHRAFLGDAFPAIGQFQADAVATFQARGYVKSILGRRARLDSSRFAYRAVSRIIQNSGGDHMKAALLLACQFEDRYPDDIQILLTIHDSIVFQARKGCEWMVRELVDALDRVASNAPFNLIVPIPTELTGGNDWAEASYSAKIKSVKGGWQEGWGIK